MVSAMLIEIFQVDVSVPKGLTSAASNAIRRTLRRPNLRRRMTAALQELVRQYPSLKPVRIKVSW